MAAEYKPSQDTRWVDIQKRTFTRWANNFLSERMMKINDIGTDLSDGLLLINLLEIISDKQLQGYNKKPKIRAQKLENTGLALRFLKQEGIKLVAIGPEDISDGNLKLILGMIWTIILRYQINKGGASNSAKNDLLEWVRKKIPECNINNFLDSWSDGRAICHLVEALDPGAFGPLDGLNPANALENARRGEEAAEEKMGIPMIMDPEDMVAAGDELSCMTYISYFRDYEANEGRRRAAEIAARTADPSKCIAFGPGLEKGEALIPGDFTIQLRNAAGANITNPIKEYKPVITITGPSVGVVCDQKYNGDGTFSCQYVPTKPGKHTIDIKIENQGISQNPWTVPIDKAQPDLEKSKVYGRGVDGPVVQGEDAPFTIESVNRLGKRIPDGGDAYVVKVLGPNNRVLDSPVKDNQNGTYSATYKPVDYGDHVVEVTLGGKPVAQSPYHVKAARPAGYPAAFNCFADGPGIKGGDTAEPSVFTIHARDENNHVVVPKQNPFLVMITDPQGDDLDANVVDNKDGTYGVTYQALKVGKHTIVVGLKNPVIPTNFENIKDSPFHPIISQGTDPTKTIAYGDGLEDGKVQDNLPTNFKIESRDRDGNKVPRGGDPYQVTVQGPSGPVPADIKDNGDGTYDVTYAPNEAGPHKIQIALRNKPVAKSPYHVNVKEGADHRTSNIDKVVFTIQSKTKSGKPLNRGGEPFEASISPVPSNWKWSDNNDGTYTGSFGPVAAGSSFNLSIKVNKKDIVGSPTTLKF
jgi:filamin